MEYFFLMIFHIIHILQAVQSLEIQVQIDRYKLDI